MAWYNDDTRNWHIATYSSEKAMRTEVEAAAQFGYMPQATARKGNEWTVTYLRDERDWARIQAENALQQVYRERGGVIQAKDKAAKVLSEVRTNFATARNNTSDPVALEQRLLKSVSDLVAARQSANSQRHLVLSALQSLQSAYDEASKLQVPLSSETLDTTAESVPVREEIDTESACVARDQLLKQAQQDVVNSVKGWKNAVGDRWGAHARVQKNSASAKTSTGEAGQAKHQARLEHAEVTLQQQEETLLRLLEIRDTRMQSTLA